MDDRIKILIISIVVVIVILIVLWQVMKNDSDDGAPTFTVFDLTMSKNEQTSGQTENYTTDELAEMSKSVEFTFKFTINSGAEKIDTIKVTRTHGTYTETKTVSGPYTNNEFREAKFSPLSGENVIGEHSFALTYDSIVFGNSVQVTTRKTTINSSQLSAVIDTGNIQTLSLIETGNFEVTTVIPKKRVIIKKNGVDIFEGEEVYLSPIENTNGGVCIRKMSDGGSIQAGSKFPIEISDCIPLYFSKYDEKFLISTLSDPDNTDAKFLNFTTNYTKVAPTNYNYKGRINSAPYMYNARSTMVYYNDDRENALEKCAEWCNNDANFVNTEFNGCVGFVIENGWDHRRINGRHENNTAMTCRPIDTHMSPTNECNIDNPENLWNGTCSPAKPRGTPDVDYNGIQNGLYWNEQKRVNSWTRDESVKISYVLTFEILSSGPITDKLFTLEYV